MAALGVLTAGALSLGVAAPAHAVVDMAPLSSYQLTVPPSVYSASAGYSAAEQAMWRESVRVGVDAPKPPTVPVSGATAWGILGGVQAMWLGGQFIVENAGTFGTVLGVSPSQLQSRYDEQGLSATEGWQCESLQGDWLGDVVTGFNDWFQSLWGIDCAALRDGTLEKNPAWEPLQVTDPTPGAYPHTVAGVTFGVPFWSDARLMLASGTQPVDRVEGWVIPLSGTYNQSNFPQITAELQGPDGMIDRATSNGAFTGPGTMNADRTSDGPCPPTANLGCLIVDAWTTSTTGLEVTPGVGWNYSNPAHWRAASGSPYRMKAVASSTWTAVAPLPYVDPTWGGAGYVEPGQEVVFLTTVETGDGNVFTCRTEPFLETDVDVPTPCEPEIPADEWIASRTVEMIPATATDWVTGSDPRRVMTDQESPQEYRDWKTAFPMCADIVCRMDLVKIGKGSCFGLGDECDGWATDPNRASLYRCTYNGSTISLGECEAGYPNVFNQEARDLGQAYPQPVNPATGQPQPSTGGQTSTVAGPVTAPGSQPLPPNEPRNCFPEGWGVLNPFEWVYKPVRCALEWAFVPRQEVVDGTARNIRTVWTASSLVSLLGVLEEGADLTLGGSGCSGPHVALNIMGGEYSGYPLSACASPMSEVATASRTVTMIAAWIMALASIARSVAGVVGFTKIGGDDA